MLHEYPMKNMMADEIMTRHHVPTLSYFANDFDEITLFGILENTAFTTMATTKAYRQLTRSFASR
eukprot:7601130-Karenia_brevis.AAC.1